MARLVDNSRLSNEDSIQKQYEIFNKEFCKFYKNILESYRKKYKMNGEILKKINECEEFRKDNIQTQILQSKNGKNSVYYNKKRNLKTCKVKEIKDIYEDHIKYDAWVKNLVLDSERVYYLRYFFQELLEALPTSCKAHINPIEKNIKNNYELYHKYWRVFSELLAEMEQTGVKVDNKYLKVNSFLIIHYRKFK